jgi:hypothetical protein
MAVSRLFVLLLAAALAGCGVRASAEEDTTQRRQLDLITAEEIQAAERTDALQIVTALRPQWLRGRGTDTANPAARTRVVVYMDGIRMGPAESLASISASTVASIQYLDGQRATSRFGLDHGSGAILVTTRGR